MKSIFLHHEYANKQFTTEICIEECRTSYL